MAESARDDGAVRWVGLVSRPGPATTLADSPPQMVEIPVVPVLTRGMAELLAKARE